MRADVCVIGGGAAGMTAAGFALSRGLDVVIIEKNQSFGKKLRITGKGRCNLVNACPPDVFLSSVVRGDRFLRSCVYAFPPQEIMRFFEGLGVPLKVERGNRVFPQSDDAADVVSALARFCEGATRVRGEASDIIVSEGSVRGVKLKSAQTIDCNSIILAAGGFTYPATGSTGDGYAMARALGHTVSEPTSALVPLSCSDADVRQMQGLSLKNVALRAKKDGKKLFDEQGEMLFTHFGVSGPLVLSLSSVAAGTQWDKLDVSIDLKPALDEGALDRRLLRDFSENLNREFKNSLAELLPKSLIPAVVARSGIQASKKINSVTAAERRSLLEVLKRFTLHITGPRSPAEAIITSGGVSLKEIDPKNMQSKLISGLYFAGEIIDADALTGGFNLGIAFATGAAAGKNAGEKR